MGFVRFFKRFSDFVGVWVMLYIGANFYLYKIAILFATGKYIDTDNKLGEIVLKRMPPKLITRATAIEFARDIHEFIKAVKRKM